MDKLTETDKKYIKLLAHKWNIPEATVANLISRYKKDASEFSEDTYEDKRFNAYTHWCNENNKEYNESERDKFYKQYDAEQQIKEDFEDE